MEASYISATQFTVSGDLTDIFVVGRRVRGDCGVDGYKYGTVANSSYSDPNTTVTLEESVLTSNLTDVHYGINKPGSSGSLPDHADEHASGGRDAITGLKETVPVFIPIEWGIDGSTPPAEAETISSGVGKLRVRLFSGTASQDLVVPWEVPADIYAADGIKFKVHGVITESTPPSGEGMSFSLSGFSLGNDDPLGGTFGTEVIVSLTGISYAQYDRFATALSGKVTVTDLAAGETAILKFYRDHDHASDTYAQAVGITGITIEYTRATVNV